MTTSAAPSATAVVVRRIIKASRERVFRAWIDPQMMSKWFARNEKMPPGVVVEADARPGGRYIVDVRGEPNHTLYRMQGEYREVKPPERLVFTWWYEQADFRDSVVTIEFRETGVPGETEVTLAHDLLPFRAREDHRKGWHECFDMLERALRGEL